MSFRSNTMIRIFARLTPVLVATALLGFGGSTAYAAPAVQRPTNMILAASSTGVNQGATVKFTGRIWQAQTGNRAPLYFYFQRRGTTTWISAGYVWSTDRGDFTKSVRVTATGTWKATYGGTVTRAAATRGRVVNVYGVTARQVAAYAETASNWQGPRITIPTADYRAVVTYTCAESGFLFLHWNGDSFGFEYVSSSNQSATLTLNGHQGARGGYFDVSTWIGCSWSVKVYAGTVRVLV